LLCVTLSLPAQKKETPGEKKLIPVTKFIPGVSQIKSSKIIKGGVLLAAFTATLIGAIVENKKGNDYYDQYLVADDINRVITLRQQTESHFKRRNLFIAGSVGVWLLHLLDLKLFKNKKGGMNGAVEKDSIHLSLYYSF